jgi:hypothetical protein
MQALREGEPRPRVDWRVEHSLEVTPLTREPRWGPLMRVHKVVRADQHYLSVLAADDNEFGAAIPGAPLLGVVGSDRLFIAPSIG